MVVYAKNKGIKPAARAYNTSPKVIRKWKKRFEEESYAGLADKSRRPFNMPNATPDKEKQAIINMRDRYKRLGAEQVKIIEELDRSAKTIRKIWREAGKARKRRPRKYMIKRNLREVKRKYKLFEYCCEDTKDLCDIPEYWPQMKNLRLPKHQYTHREVSCGIQFLGYANELSLAHSTEFARIINEHLIRHKLIPDKSTRQTDNGSEYIGAWNAKHASSYTNEIQRIKGQVHKTIPPRAYKLQGDVETVHNLIEPEFFELETFKDRLDFFEKSYSYLLFFNFCREST